MDVFTEKPAAISIIERINTTPIFKPKRLKVKAKTAKQVVNKKRILYPFEGKWLESFGRPECFAKWFITGPSGGGKSSFVYELCSYLIQFGNIDYNSYEEGDSQTTADKIVRYNLTEHKGFRILDKVPIDQWKERLKARQSASFGVMDSLQHGGMNKTIYEDLVKQICNDRRKKSMLFISHFKKDGFTGFVKHDCDIKIEVRGFIALPDISRYGGGKPFVIWEEGAKRKWGKRYKDVIAGRYWPGHKM